MGGVTGRLDAEQSCEEEVPRLPNSFGQTFADAKLAQGALDRLACAGHAAPMTLDRFYPIVDSANWVARLLACGARLIQLRVKGTSPMVVHSEIARAKSLCEAADAVLVVNDFWQAAIALACPWVHLGQEDLETADVPAIRRAGLKIGVSTHDEAELERALALAPDYVALGPIYPTRLKAMRFAPQGLERLGAWKARGGAEHPAGGDWWGHAGEDARRRSGRCRHRGGRHRHHARCRSGGAHAGLGRGDAAARLTHRDIAPFTSVSRKL